MNGGVKGLLVAASFAAAGCASAPNAVEIRPIADPASKLRPGADLLADAKGQLALGNVGLALEGFRKAARDYPDNAEAYAGMAACYEAMRRYDLAELKYQAALSLAPRNATLLAKLAGALDQQGKSDAAAEVRGEIAQIASASAALDQAEADPEPAAASLAPAQTVTVVIPAPKLAASGPVALPVPAQAAEQPKAEAPIPAPRLTDKSQVNVLVGLAPRLDPVPIGQLAPVLAVPAEPVPAMIPAPRLDEQVRVNVVAGLATRLGPRLERMSLGEVALLTGGRPVWRGQVVARTPQKLTVRWVPVTTAAVRPNIRLLNAARVQGLAARNRSYLLDRGWRKIEIGDATATRDRSLVLYPATRPSLGRSLAAQFGFRAQPTDSSEVFVILLGRDAAGMRAAPTRG